MGDALARGLVDELKTSSQYLLERMQAGATLFSLKYKPPSQSPLAGLVSTSSRAAILADLLTGMSKQSPGEMLGKDALRGLLGRQTRAEQMQFLSTDVLPTIQALPPDL